MPKLYSAESDGSCYHDGTATDYGEGALATGWDGQHDDTKNKPTGQSSYQTIGIHQTTHNPAGVGQFWLARAFWAFDTSGITVAPSSAAFKLWYNGGDTGYELGCILVKATAPDLTTEIDDLDFNALDGWQVGFNNTHLTAYSEKNTESIDASTSAAENVHIITLNAAARADMASLDIFKICMMDYTHDYLDDNPIDNGYGTGGQSIHRRYPWTYESHPPPLDQTHPYVYYVAGHRSMFATARSNIKKVFGVLSANVVKVMGR